MEKIEKQSRFWIGLLVLIMSVIYILVTLGKTEWTQWIAIVFGGFLFFFLLSEASIVEYFRSKKYKTFGFGDIMVWLTLIFAIGVLLNTMLLIQVVNNVTPVWLINFATVSGVVVGAGAGILAVIHLLTGKFS